MNTYYINKAKQYLSSDSDEDIKKMIELICKHENKDDLIENVDDFISVWQPLENTLTCEIFLESIGFEKETIMLSSIMKRYGGLLTLKQAMYEDTDTVLVNLCADVNYIVSEDDFLMYIRKIL